MIQLKDINKTYTAGDTIVKALNNINVNFREKEFVSILGPSGCGKTTLLNILGGLDRYDYGDIIVNGTSTKQFKDKDWDAYRNHYIGFVFQSYNLIPHLTVVENVEFGKYINLMPASKYKGKELYKYVENIEKVDDNFDDAYVEAKEYLAEYTDDKEMEKEVSFLETRIIK